MARVQCCAPFCRKVWRGEAYVEQLCPTHYMRVDNALRIEYEMAWLQVTTAEKILGQHNAEDGLYIRVARAWDAVKADAAKALAN